MTIRRILAVVALVGAALLGACAETIPQGALALSSETMERRQLQTRRFDTTDEPKLLVASAGLLQDLGYTIDSSQPTVGLIAASKERDATDGGQVAGAIFAALMGVQTPIDKNQKIRVSVVTTPHAGYTTLRVTCQRVIWNTMGQISRAEFVSDPAIYKEFFEKLSKSVFLEANEI